MRMRWGWLLAFGVLFGVAGCSAAPASSQSDATAGQSRETGEQQTLEGELQVYAAVSLKGAFDELLEQFAADHPNVKVMPAVYDGSSTLVTQIIEGAPADVFASADEENMAKIGAAGLIDGEPTIFATNTITAAVSQENPQNIEHLQQLANPNVKVVLCAPEVPCGAAAAKVLEATKLDLVPVSEEQNVSAVVTKITNGEADAGFIYVTDVAASGGQLNAIDTPVEESAVNRYPIVPLSESTSPAVAKAFSDFVVSDRGQEILRDYGFGAK